ncbi:hypothetical protein TrST_g326 [Triparma strigata]|uniref:Uncharacterized protein n=1 Tax=Triparma strigata TaxID=1606541 RepID=A0A9W6ZKD8_9STRA|nr:hypothetical protein TrST_g326 [Triparma strigata]
MCRRSLFSLFSLFAVLSVTVVTVTVTVTVTVVSAVYLPNGQLKRSPPPPTGILTSVYYVNVKSKKYVVQILSPTINDPANETKYFNYTDLQQQLQLSNSTAEDEPKDEPKDEPQDDRSHSTQATTQATTQDDDEKGHGDSSPDSSPSSSLKLPTSPLSLESSDNALISIPLQSYHDSLLLSGYRPSPVPDSESKYRKTYNVVPGGLIVKTTSLKSLKNINYKLRREDNSVQSVVACEAEFGWEVEDGFLAFFGEGGWGNEGGKLRRLECGEGEVVEVYRGGVGRGKVMEGVGGFEEVMGKLVEGVGGEGGEGWRGWRRWRKEYGGGRGVRAYVWVEEEEGVWRDN